MGKESLQWPSSEWVCVSVHVEERVEKVRQVYRECVFVAQGEMQEQVGGPTLWEERKSSKCGQCVCVRLRDAVWLKSLCLSIIRFSAADATLAHLRTRALPWHTHTHTRTVARTDAHSCGFQEEPEISVQRSTGGHWKSCRGQRSWQYLKVRGGVRAKSTASWASGLYWRDCWRLRYNSTLLWSAGKSCSAAHTHLTEGLCACVATRECAIQICW